MASKKKSKKVKPPSGLSIQRSGDKYIFSWRKGENYTKDQKLQICFVQTNKSKTPQNKDKSFEKSKKNNGKKLAKDVKWQNVSVTKNTTKYTANKKGDFYPDTYTSGNKTHTHAPLDGILMRVKGVNGKGKESDWSFKSVDIAVPVDPKIYVEWAGQDASNTSTFTIVATEKEKAPVNKIEYQTRLSDSADENNKGWGSSVFVKKTAVVKAFSEDNPTKVRGVRARIHGAGGWTGWKYAFHSYANPGAPTNITLNSYSEDAEAGAMVLNLGWTTSNTKAKPIETVNVNYYIGNPDTDFKPSQGSWVTGRTVKDTRSSNPEQSTTMIVNQLLGLDQCMWIQIVSNHDDISSPSSIKIFDELIGKLTPPTITRFDINTDHSITVNARSDTSALGTYLAVIYSNESDEENDGKIIGCIPASQYGQTISFKCPNWGESDTPKFYMYTFIPDGDIITNPSSLSGYNGVIEYTFIPKMISDKVYDSEVIPDYPTMVNVEKTNIPGTLQVTWNNPWTASNGAEVLWANHDDALYSTDGPSTYMIENSRQQKLNISGLDLGITWYIWVRLYKNVNDTTVYGPYSDVIEKDLSTVPAVPNLSVSQTTITEDGSSMASWVYVTDDETTQEDYTLYEVIETEVQGEIEKTYTPLELTNKSGTQQSYEIKPLELGWATGSTHVIVLQVQSSAGKVSDYSNEVSIVVADKINMTFSVEGDGVLTEFNPETYSGTTITIPGADNPKEIHTLIETLPYESAGYTQATLVQNGSNNVVDWGETTGPDGETIESNVKDFYGGELDFVSGELKSLYSSDGSLLTDPVIYNVGALSISLTSESGDEFSAGGNFLNIKIADNQKGMLVLRSLPMTVTVTGAGTSGVTTLAVRRYEDFVVERPDESNQYGYDGETVSYFYKSGEEPIVIRTEDVYGHLDDGARYVLVANVIDNNGQTASNVTESSPGQIFEVNWEHQAIAPEPDIVMGDNHAEISVPMPTGADSTDRIYIYRLSADKPELIYRDAVFYDDNNPKTTTYVDPYPTIGSRGGYRVVLVTKDGDYVDKDGIPSWFDYDGGIQSDFQLINFDGRELPLRYNVSIDNSWSKSFTKTHYLGGSIQGDWLEGVEKSGNLKGVVLDDLNPEEYESFRDLGDYPGLCHVRSIDGGNYTADINVSDSSTYNSPGHQHDISLTITRVDNTSLDGMTLEDWERIQEE